MKKITVFLLVSILVLSLSAAAGAATLPDVSQGTAVTADVSEQADITVPVMITFNVTDIKSDTNGVGFVNAESIVLNEGNALKISLKGNAQAYPPPFGGGTTWGGEEVRGAAGTWEGGTGTAGTLSTAYTEVAHSVKNAEILESDITFTLKAKSINRAGNYTLALTWKFESFTP